MRKYQKYEDLELTILLREGNTEAFAEVYDRFFSSLYYHALSRLRDSAEAKDAVQDLFINLWNKRETANYTNLSNYLFTAIRNKIINIVAHKDVKSRYLLNIPTTLHIETSITDHRVRERQLATLIDREIAQLPSKMREVFEMSRKQHLSHKEISEKLGISEQSVRSHIKNALKILRSRLGLVFFLVLLFNK
jgi:RNA polymerase sigma-70 factor (family 1)